MSNVYNIQSNSLFQLNKTFPVTYALKEAFKEWLRLDVAAHVIVYGDKDKLVASTDGMDRSVIITYDYVLAVGGTKSLIHNYYRAEIDGIKGIKGHTIKNIFIIEDSEYFSTDEVSVNKVKLKKVTDCKRGYVAEGLTECASLSKLLNHLLDSKLESNLTVKSLRIDDCHVLIEIIKG